jgi:hypothetical protein
MSNFRLPVQRKVITEPALRRMTLNDVRTKSPKNISRVRRINRIKRKGCSDTPPNPRSSSEET